MQQVVLRIRWEGWEAIRRPCSKWCRWWVHFRYAPTSRLEETRKSWKNLEHQKMENLRIRLTQKSVFLTRNAFWRWPKLPKGNFLKGCIHPKGYKIVGIGRVSENGGHYNIHRLVAQIFLPNYYGKPFVNHKDHNRANCKLYNLEWVTPKENAIAAVKHYSKLKK